MTSEIWRQVEELFEAALERAPIERAAFLGAACAGNPILQNEVESLLAADAQGDGLIDRPLLQVSEMSAAMDEPQCMEGRRIGHYQIIRELNRGGMGVVYQAVRADDQYEKRVAIKLIKRGVDTEDVLRRFRHERQILANLDHPNIARLLDGGTTEGSLPYFVMEYIEGVPINEYCDTHELNTTERLKLFRTVCAAVHYAHQNLVIHRDLKPSNILVTAEGVPKLLDFGIAKLLNPDLSDHTSDLTATALRLMTPEYASPEQIRGESITTASDIYSLGVVLYELLTGHRPYRLKSRLPHEIAQIICDVEPERPSQSIADCRMRNAESKDTPQSTIRDSKSLRGDLDNIVLKTLSKEPPRRYASVNQMSEDIRRHLEGLPVVARKDTFSYRTGKFIRRNKAAVTAAAAGVLLIVGFSINAMVQSARMARERDKAERISAFLVDMFDAYDPNDTSEVKGRVTTVREALDRGARKVVGEFKDQPDVQATLMETIGEIYQSHGLYDNARPLVETALKIRRDTLGDEHPQVAESLNDLALLMRDMGDHKAAETLAREALAIRRRVLGSEHPEVATNLNGLAYVMRSKGNYEAAESFVREALAIRRKAFGGEHLQVAISLGGLAYVLRDKGDYRGAEPLCREYLAMLRKLLGNEHPEVARALNLLALLMHDKGDYQAAEPLAKEALALRRRLLGGEHPEVARSLNNLASLMRDKGDYGAAEPLYREALEMRRKLLSDEHPEVAISLSNLGNLQRLKGAYESGEPLLREALTRSRKAVGNKHPDTAQVMSNLGLLLVDKGDYILAEPYLREALSMRYELLGEVHPEVGRSASHSAELLYLEGDYHAARSLYRTSLDIYQKALPEKHQNVAHALIGLGSLLIRTGEPQAAEPLVRKGLSILRQQLADGNWLVTDAESVLGECLAALNRYEEAEPLLIRSYPVIKASRGERNGRTLEALNRIITLYQSWGKPNRAAEYRAMLTTVGAAQN